MNRFTYLAAGIVCLAGFSTTAWAGDISVTVHNVDQEAGNLRFAVCDKENWLTYHCPYKEQADTKPGDVTVDFRNIPAGKWAVIVVHDANLNGKLDENFLGIPTEQFGFSNNPGFGHEPKFDEAKFTVGDQKLNLSVDFEK